MNYLEGMMAIDTRKVANRRQLHFQTIDDMLKDVERLNEGKIKPLGNWSGGQILKHLATVMNTSIDRSPLRLSWFIRLLGWMMKRRILTKGMIPGFQLKGKTADFLVPPPTAWEEGLEIFRQAVRRQQTESRRQPSPFLGTLTREQWEQLHCRHAELHLSFLLPANEPS
jgi:hypothetical protein